MLSCFHCSKKPKIPFCCGIEGKQTFFGSMKILHGSDYWLVRAVRGNTQNHNQPPVQSQHTNGSAFVYRNGLPEWQHLRLLSDIAFAGGHSLDNAWEFGPVPDLDPICNGLVTIDGTGKVVMAKLPKLC